MKVAFQKADHSFFASLIRWWTKSPYSHCELLFDDGLMFSAHAKDHGTRYVTPGVLSANEWDVLLLPATLEQEIAVRTFCNAELHCGYDWWGLIFSQVLRLQRPHPDKWFCSEVCTAALQHMGMLFGAVPCTFSPGKLYKRLREAGAITCAQ